jgi:hypothetical protein
MGSRAFTAVSRAVLFAMRDPDEDGRYLLGQPKNNLGRLDLATLCYEIEDHFVMETEEGPIFTGKLLWKGETERSVADALEAANRGEDRSKVEEATDWLSEYMEAKGGFDLSKDIKNAAKNAGISLSTLKRAKIRLNLQDESSGFPRRTYWLSPGTDLPEDA